VKKPGRGGARPGAGRKPLVEGEETVNLTVRLRLADFAELRALVEDGHGPALADAVRWLLDESARRRGRRKPAE
jgi:hypothetical protein